MPIYLAPQNRRRFLQGATAAASALLVGVRAPLAWSGPSVASDPNRFALLSDTHISKNRNAAVGDTNMYQNLNRAVSELLTACGQAGGPGALLHAGDCAFLGGGSDDYVVLLELLAPLRKAGLPMHVALGNHDHRERFWSADPALKSAQPEVGDKQVAVVESPNANWFMLDSLVKVLYTPGQFGDAQLKWLAGALDARSDKPAIILAHHNPSKDSGPGASLIDWQALRDIIMPRRHVKAFVFGHTHFWQYRKEDGLHLINLPPVAYPSSRGGPSGWVDARLEKSNGIFELHSLDEKHPAHGQKLELAWRT